MFPIFYVLNESSMEGPTSGGVNRAPNFKAHLKKPSPSPLN